MNFERTLSGNCNVNTCKVLVTGSAGFIGHHLVTYLCENNFTVIGLDVINKYYDPSLKFDRLRNQGFTCEDISYNMLLNSSLNNNSYFIQLDLVDSAALDSLFTIHKFDIVVNLAAQAGVRYSLEAPKDYVQSNLVGFANILETSCRHQVKHLLFASSSSVYGNGQHTPFTTNHTTDFPTSFYAATKKANEVMAHSYSYVHGLPVSGLRLFSVYGPWGRPDMAYYSFTKAILAGEPLKIFNNGNSLRDFTFIDDVINVIAKLIIQIPSYPKDSSFRMYNVGKGKPDSVLNLVSVLEKLLNKKAKKTFHDNYNCDVENTFADVSELRSKIKYFPSTSLEQGLKVFIEWFNGYYGC